MSPPAGVVFLNSCEGCNSLKVNTTQAATTMKVTIASAFDTRPRSRVHQACSGGSGGSGASTRSMVPVAVMLHLCCPALSFFGCQAASGHRRWTSHLGGKLQHGGERQRAVHAMPPPPVAM